MTRQHSSVYIRGVRLRNTEGGLEWKVSARPASWCFALRLHRRLLSFWYVGWRSCSSMPCNCVCVVSIWHLICTIDRKRIWIKASGHNFFVFFVFDDPENPANLGSDWSVLLNVWKTEISNVKLVYQEGLNFYWNVENLLEQTSSLSYNIYHKKADTFRGRAYNLANDANLSHNKNSDYIHYNVGFIAHHRVLVPFVP